MTTTVSRYARPAGFALFAATIYGAALLVAPHIPFATAQGMVAVVLTLDLVVFVPLAYHLLLVRGRGWPAVTTGAIFFWSLFAAHFVIPSAHQAFLHLLTYAAVPLEVLLTSYVLFKATRKVQRVGIRRSDPEGTDLLEHLRRTMRQALDVRILADAVAYEMAVFYYALFSWRRSEAVARSKAQTYTYHETSGYGTMLAGIMMAVTVELVAGHLLLHLWNPTVAWIHTALGLYGTLWLIGDYRAMRFRPIYLRDDALQVRCGLRWSMRIPLPDIAGVDQARRHHSNEEGYLNASPSLSPQFVIRLKCPIVAEGPYGTQKNVQVLAISVDEPEQFQNVLSERRT